MEAFAQRLDLLEGHEAGGFVAVHPPRVIVDDVLETRQPVPHFQDLVDLLLVFGHDDARLGGFEHPGQLARDRVLVEPDGQDAGALGREFGDHPLRPVVSDDREPVPPLNAQLGQPQREGAHPAEILRPGDLLPDAELLLAQGDPVGMTDGVTREQTRKRLFHSVASRPCSALFTA